MDSAEDNASNGAGEETFGKIKDHRTGRRAVSDQKMSSSSQKPLEVAEKVASLHFTLSRRSGDSRK